MMPVTKTTLYKTMIVGCLLLGQFTGWALAGDETLLQESQPAPAQQTLEQRLQPYLQSQDAWIIYQAQKAQMWLTYANNEHSEHSLTLAGREAQAEAIKLIEQLEQHQQISPVTSVISVSKVMRRDLWVNAELLKQQDGFDCDPADIAQAEVTLVWAAAEYCELGWRHSRELFAAAERLIDSANAKVLNCHGVTQRLPKVSYPSMEELNGIQSGCHGVAGSWPIVPVVSTTAAAEIQSTEETEVPPAIQAEQTIPNNVHFALDSNILSDTSQQVLDQVAQVLTKNPDYSVTLYGYTDSRASAAYNLALSRRRAAAVADYLGHQGIEAKRIATVAAGKNRQIDDEDTKTGFALSRRVELVYANPDGKEIESAPQRSDLQPEP